MKRVFHKRLNSSRIEGSRGYSRGVKRLSLILILSLMILTILASSAPASAKTIIINSQDWKDVYSGLIYANLQQTTSYFLTGVKAGLTVLNPISKKDDIEVLSSRKNPFVVGYEDVIRSRGFENVDETRYRDMNFQLAEKLENIHKFIIVDDSYGYNALAVAPYAVASGSYVLFADAKNIGKITRFLRDRGVDQLLIFGQVDREVKDALAEFNPEIINKGDRFDNDLAIVDKFMKINPTKQVILSNGEFMEASMFQGKNPIIFIGRLNVPEVVKDYIKNSNIDVGVLIGNELVGTATFIRRQLGISVFVKFAQGARNPQGAISQVEDLDRFPMPKYELRMKIHSIIYNKATRSIEVTYKNEVDQAIYFKSTITINNSNGDQIIIGDENPVFIDGQNYKTIIYQYDTDGQPLNLDGDLVGSYFTIFGESPKSMEYILKGKLSIDQIEVLDDSKIEIKDLYYDKSAKKFYAIVENTGPVDAYVNVELVDLIINDEPVRVAADDTVLIKKGHEAKIPISIEMSEVDFQENPEVKVRAYYGERKLALVKITEATFAFRAVSGMKVIYEIVGAIILLALLIFLGTKKKCKHCGHKNPRGRKRCEKCGAKL